MPGADKQQDVLQVQGLAKSYPHPMTRRSMPVLKQIDFTVRSGEVFGLIGPNGAGKTTTIKAIMGLIAPDAGTVRLFGRSVNVAAVKARIGFLPENPSFYEYLTGEEFLQYYGRLYGMDRARRRERVEQLLALVELERVRQLPLRKFSKGMIQRIGLAQALLNDPDFLVLDEPMSGLDPLGRRMVRRIIQNLSGEGKTIFFTSHILSDTELLCDRVALVVGGRLRDLGAGWIRCSARRSAAMTWWPPHWIAMRCRPPAGWYRPPRASCSSPSTARPSCSPTSSISSRPGGS